MPKPSSFTQSPASNEAPPTPSTAERAPRALAGAKKGPPVSVGAHQARPAALHRRAFTVEQKRAIVAEADRCVSPGDVGALLRKYGIYSSLLSKWRSALSTGAVLRGPGRPPQKDEKDKEIAELRRHVGQLEARVRRAESLVELQKKVQSLLEAAAAFGTNS